MQSDVEALMNECKRLKSLKVAMGQGSVGELVRKEGRRGRRRERGRE